MFLILLQKSFTTWAQDPLNAWAERIERASRYMGWSTFHSWPSRVGHQPPAHSINLILEAHSPSQGFQGSWGNSQQIPQTAAPACTSSWELPCLWFGLHWVAAVGGEGWGECPGALLIPLFGEQKREKDQAWREHKNGVVLCANGNSVPGHLLLWCLFYSSWVWPLLDIRCGWMQETAFLPVKHATVCSDRQPLRSKWH